MVTPVDPSVSQTSSATSRSNPALPDRYSGRRSGTRVFIDSSARSAVRSSNYGRTSGCGATRIPICFATPEEALAEAIGTGSLRKGLIFPLQGGYDLSVARIIAEGGGYVVVVGGTAYAVYELSGD